MQKTIIKNVDNTCRDFGSSNQTPDAGGSPIELAFFMALLKTFNTDEFKPFKELDAVYVEQRDCLSIEEVKEDFFSSGALLVAYREVNIGRYRADFVFGAQVPVNEAGDTVPQFVIVELDGHDFHEKTKYQAERDKKRDRYLQCHGFIVLRYTGSEVWRSPMACVYKAITEIAASTTSKYETANVSVN